MGDKQQTHDGGKPWYHTVGMRLIETAIMGGIILYGQSRVMQYSIESNASKIIDNAVEIKKNADDIDDLTERTAIVETRVGNVEERVRAAR